MEVPHDRGDILNEKYEVFRVLGKKHLSTVYLVYSRESQSFLALKTYPERYLHDTEIPRLFETAATHWEHAGRHPFLCEAYFFEYFDEQPYLGIEYVSPAPDHPNSLKLHLLKKTFTLPQVLKYSIQVCYAMEFLYSRGFSSHGSMKPSNIYLAQDGIAKISNCGMAKMAEAKPELLRKDLSAAIYRAPEVFDGTPPNEKTDVYAFGIVLYQMCCGGKLPFLPGHPSTSGKDAGKFWEEIERMHKESEIPTLRSPLLSLILQCLEKKPSDRISGFSEIRAKFEAMLLRISGETVQLPDSNRVEQWEWNNKGLTFLDLGLLNEAVSSFDNALKFDTTYERAWINKGIALISLRRYEEAIGAFEEALQLDPNNPTLWSNKGLALQKSGDIEEAGQCFDRALEIDPLFSSAWFHKGKLYAEHHLFDQALLCLHGGLELDPRNIDGWAQNASCLWETGRLDEAFNSLLRALEVDAQNVTLLSRTGQLLGELGRLEEAFEYHQRAIERETRDPDVWFRYGETLAQDDRLEEALECFDKTVEIEPYRAEFWVRKAALLTRISRFREAMMALDRAAELETDNAQVWFQKGWNLRQLGRDEEAIRSLEKALKLNPSLVQAWLEKAQSEEALSRLDSAMRSYEQFLALHNVEDSLMDFARDRLAVLNRTID